MHYDTIKNVSKLVNLALWRGVINSPESRSVIYEQPQPAVHIGSLFVLGPIFHVEVVAAGLAQAHGQQRVTENPSVSFDNRVNLKFERLKPDSGTV